MNKIKPIPLLLAVFATMLMTSAPAGIALADDTEIYSTAISSATSPQVLVIIDNSTSMNSLPTGASSGPTKIEIARTTIKGVIDANPTINFGLAVFNLNDLIGPHGGRIIAKVGTQNLAEDSGLVDMLTATSHTSLCETLYEASLYYRGENVDYGDDDSRGPPSLPNRDLTAETGGTAGVGGGGTYISPLNTCKKSYIILVTDGQPSNDTDANGKIETLTGKTCRQYLDSSGINMTKNCMPELAHWMATNDVDGDTTNGSQNVVTFTVGFDTNQQLLQDMAEGRTDAPALTFTDPDNQKGKYFTSSNATTLKTSIQQALDIIDSRTTTLTSPAVAASTFDQTRSLNEAYLPMFEPLNTPRWNGNIKKLTISNGILVDSTPEAATGSDGLILDAATTLWDNTGVNASKTTVGGVGALLVANTSRTIKTNTGSSNALEDFSSTNFDTAAFGLANGDTAGLYAKFGVTDQDDLTATVNWAEGQDVQPGNTSSATRREWILADSLHSKPLAINYGCDRAANSTCVPDIRVVIGTNGGFLHMFGNTDGEEDWAFFPKELASILKILRTNDKTVAHPYGIDATPSVYIKDTDGDGYIGETGDKVYLYVGMRRGGRVYYALDITDPDNPSMLWQIDNTTTGFSQLGQSWSTPVKGFIPGYVDGSSNPKPVLIFSAGYDNNKDLTGVGTADSMGRGIFIVDAATGAIVWSITPAADSATNKQETGLTDSVVADVSPMDSNGDGLIDRIYFPDTGGNIWRVDMPGNTLPTATQTTWSIFKIALLGGTTAATDRRFFNKIDVVRTRDGSLSFDALLIGSGNRAKPNETITNNRLYMIRDTELATSYHSSDATEITNGATEIPAAIEEGNLYPADDNLIQQPGTSDEDRTTAIDTLALVATKGWYVSLGDSGEKSLSRAITLSGTVFFTSYVPAVIVANPVTCDPQMGSGFLYALNLRNATAVYNLGSIDGDPLTAADRRLKIGDQILDTPTIHVDSDGNIDLLPPTGAGGSAFEDKLSKDKLGLKLRPAGGTYWYKEAN